MVALLRRWGWMNGSFGGGAVSDLRRSRGAIGIVVWDARANCLFLGFGGMGEGEGDGYGSLPAGLSKCFSLGDDAVGNAWRSKLEIGLMGRAWSSVAVEGCDRVGGAPVSDWEVLAAVRCAKRRRVGPASVARTAIPFC